MNHNNWKEHMKQFDEPPETVIADGNDYKFHCKTGEKAKNYKNIPGIRNWRYH